MIKLKNLITQLENSGEILPGRIDQVLASEVTTCFVGRIGKLFVFNSFIDLDFYAESPYECLTGR